MLLITRIVILQGNIPAAGLGAVVTATSIFIGALCLGALICAIFAFRRGRPGRGRAGIAIGIATVIIIGIANNYIINGVTTMFYYLR